MTLFSLLIVLLSAAGLLLLAYIAVVLLVRMVAFAIMLFKVLTGRVTREQLAEAAAKRKEEEEQEKAMKRLNDWLDDLTRPSALDVAMGRSRKDINIDITIEKDTKD